MKQDALTYWVCDNCGRRHDLLDPVPLSRTWTTPALHFKCDGCQYVTHIWNVMQRYREEKGIRERWTDIQKILKHLESQYEVLGNLTTQLVRIERQLDDLTRR